MKWLIPFLLLGCSTFSDRQYQWHLKYPKYDQVQIRIVDNPADNCSLEPGAFACTVLLLDECIVFFPKDIHELPAEVVKHELRHCRGWSHTE